MILNKTMQSKIRGRGTAFNPPNRFERLYIEDFNADELDSFFTEVEKRKIKTKFYKDTSKSIISVNKSEDIGFDYSFNPYRGCEHGCIYCYARPFHEYLGFSSGLDFESKIMVKEDAPKLLEQTFRKKSYEPKIIMFSGVTDCYQPAEWKLKLTRKALEVCLKYRNPVIIITKNSLVMRDIDVLSELSKLNLVLVCLSITSLDKSLINKMEPKTSIPSRRLEAIETLSKNGICAGANVAPIIPGLNDEEIPEILKQVSNHGGKFANYIILRLPYSVKDLFVDWLKKEFPDRAEKVINRIKEVREGKLNESEFGKRFVGVGKYYDTIHDLFKLNRKKYGLDKNNYQLTTKHFVKAAKSQMELF